VPVTPIQHVVVIFQENHTFDNLLGGVCVEDHLGCDTTTSGVLDDGTRIPLSVQPDIVPQVDHSVPAQNTSFNDGAMNGFNQIAGCGPPQFACYSQVPAAEIPNLAKLAQHYVISDHTFSEEPVPSFGGHLALVAGQLDGFRGDNPYSDLKVAPLQGWGCDSRTDEPWRDPMNPVAHYRRVPSCVPRPDGYGPFRPSPVKPVPTILDRLTSAGLSWKLYTDTQKSGTGYIWSICPYFAECLYDPNNHNRPDPNWVPRPTFKTDAAAGGLPAYSVVVPSYALSQHNQASMVQGDNYLEGLVSAVMNGPPAQWNSTVIFITYDDCGCFYDHVAPPAGLGIRLPMVIVSPQAKASFVDHATASFASMLAFVEKNWKLAPLASSDANAYDYCHSFIFTMPECPNASPALAAAYRAPQPIVRAAPSHVSLRPSPVPVASIQWVKTHPPDPNNPQDNS
jgi:phospholipase C